jgi:hypothetical protein
MELMEVKFLEPPLLSSTMMYWHGEMGESYFEVGCFEGRTELIKHRCV